MAIEERTNVRSTLTLLLIFVITVVAIVIIFAYFNGLFKFVGTGGDTMTASGYFALPGGAGNTGDIVLQVTDTSQASITGITFACPAAQFASSSCGGLVVNISGAEVSSQNPLSHGRTGTGSQTVQSAEGSAFSPGTIYSVTVTSTFSDGDSVSQTLSLPAQVG